MSYEDFKNGLETFHEYIAPENQNIPIATPFDGAVVRVELGVNPKQMLCDLLNGKFPPGLPQIQLCLDINMASLEVIASANATLLGAIQFCRAALQSFNEHTGLASSLARVNAVIGEAAAVASMIAFCSNPINPKPIPNLLETIMGSFLGAGEAILNRLGQVIPDRAGICYDPATGKIGTDVYIPGGLCEEIRNAIESGIDWGPLVDDWVKQLRAIGTDFESLINKENAIAQAAVEANGLGGSDPVETFEDANPVVSIINPLNEATATPKKVEVKNEYGGCFIGGVHDPRFQTKADCEHTNVGGTWVKQGDNNFVAGGYTGTVYTLEVTIKFSEKMDPDTIVVRGKTDHDTNEGFGNNLGTAHWGTIRIFPPSGKECLWAVKPQRIDYNYTTYRGVVYLPSDAIAANTLYYLRVGNNGRGELTNPDQIVPTSKAGKTQLVDNNTSFQINAPVTATGATNIVKMDPSDQIEKTKGSDDTSTILVQEDDISSGMNNIVNLFALWKQLSGYPLQRTDGTTVESIFHALFDENVVNQLHAGENYTAPITTTKPIYDYCGNITGYTTEFIQGAVETSNAETVAKLASVVEVAPVVTSITPARNSTDVFVDKKIKITFSQDMDPESFTVSDTRTSWRATKTYDAFSAGNWPTGATARNTVEYQGAEYSSNANNNKGNLPTDTTYWTLRQVAQPASGSSVDNSAGPTGPGVGTVRLYNDTTDKYISNIQVSYDSNNRTLTISPNTVLTAGHLFQVVIIGTSGSTTAKVDPVENTSGIPLANNFQFSFTSHSGGSTEASQVFSQSAGGSIQFPNYDFAGLGTLASGLSTADKGATAFCTNCTDGSGGDKSGIVYWTGSAWKYVVDGTAISSS